MVVCERGVIQGKLKLVTQETRPGASFHGLALC
jgi:hypothetical protein